MKKFIAIASAVVLFAGAAQAQDSTKHRMHNHAVKGQQWGKELNLTEAQKAEFKKTNEDFRAQAKTIRDNASLSQEQKKTQLEALRKQQHEKMQSVLTQEQKDQLKAHAKEGKGKRGKFAKDDDKKGDKRDFAKGKRGDFKKPNPAELKNKLNLTDDQVAKMKANGEEFKSKMEAIRSNDKLSKEQKMEQLKALQSQRQESLKSILTAEQLEKMKSFRKDRKETK